MAGTPKPYAVVSCHVERMLDDRVWEAYRKLARDRPGGFRIASLVRPPDETRGEDPVLWLARARELAAAGPFGHHTHWTAPDHARPTGVEDTGGRVLREGLWLREQGLRPTCFCGGGWYSDVSVAAACATLGYVDCTPRPARPARLAEGGAWAELAAPAHVETAAGPMLAIPTTRSLGDLARAVMRPGGLDEPVVHGYLHDTDLLGARRRLALRAALAILGRRRRPGDLDGVAALVGPLAPHRPWEAVARGRASVLPE